MNRPFATLSPIAVFAILLGSGAARAAKAESTGWTSASTDGGAAKSDAGATDPDGSSNSAQDGEDSGMLPCGIARSSPPGPLGLALVTSGLVVTARRRRR